MRLGTLCPLHQTERIPDLIAKGFGFVELCQTQTLAPLPPDPVSVPLIWQCPSDLPAEHPAAPIQAGVLATWRDHLGAAQHVKAALMVVQFRRPEILEDKTALIAQYVALLQPLTSEARAAGIQLVLRNGPDNRDQLQLLREIVRRVAGLGLALDLAYAQHRTVKNLTPEYLWDSDLGVRIAHVYASDTQGQSPALRLPPGCLGASGIDWVRVVGDLRARYNASVTIDGGDAPLEFLALSRALWLAWWQRG